MKIESSTVAMKSERSYYTHLEAHSESMVMRSDQAATLEFSDESKSLVEQMKDYKEEQKRQSRENAKKQQEQNVKNLAMAMAEAEKAKQNEPVTVQSEEDIQIETLKKILEMLKKMQNRRLGRKDTEQLTQKVEQRFAKVHGSAQRKSLTLAGAGNVIAISSGGGGAP